MSERMIYYLRAVSSFWHPHLRACSFRGWLWILHNRVDQRVWVSTFLALWYRSNHRSCNAANLMLKSYNRARLSTSWSLQKICLLFEQVEAGNWNSDKQRLEEWYKMCNSKKRVISKHRGSSSSGSEVWLVTRPWYPETKKEMNAFG